MLKNGYGYNLPDVAVSVSDQENIKVVPDEPYAIAPNRFNFKRFDVDDVAELSTSYIRVIRYTTKKMMSIHPCLTHSL